MFLAHQFCLTTFPELSPKSEEGSLLLAKELMLISPAWQRVMPPQLYLMLLSTSRFMARLKTPGSKRMKYRQGFVMKYDVQ